MTLHPLPATLATIIFALSTGRAEVFAPIQFNGTKPLAIAADPRFELGPEGTIELWVAAPATLAAGAQQVTLLAHGEGDSLNYRIILENTRKRVGIRFGASEPFMVNTDFTDGQYHHLSFVVREGNVRAFVDGRDVSGVASGFFDATGSTGVQPGFTPAPAGGRPLYVGGDAEAPGFAGFIFCARLWNKGLTVAQLEQVKQSYGPLPASDPLRANLVAFSMFTDEQQSILFTTPEILTTRGIGNATVPDLLVPVFNGLRITAVFVRSDESRGISGLIFELNGPNRIPQFIPPRPGRRTADIATARNNAIALRDQNSQGPFNTRVRQLRTLELGAEDNGQNAAVGGFSVLRLDADETIVSIATTNDGKGLRSIRFGIRNLAAGLGEASFRFSPIFGTPGIDASSTRIPMLGELAGISVAVNGDGAPVSMGLAFRFPERPSEEALPVGLTFNRWLQKDTGRPARLLPGRLDGTFSTEPAYRLEYDGRNMRLLTDSGDVRRFQATTSGKAVWQGLDGTTGLLLRPNGFEITTGVDTGAPAASHDRIALVNDDGSNRKLCAPGEFTRVMHPGGPNENGCSFDLIRYSNGKFALLAENAQFISNRGSFLEPQLEVVDDSARFRLVPMSDNKFAIQASNDKFLEVGQAMLPSFSQVPAGGEPPVASFADALLARSDTPKPFKLVPALRRRPAPGVRSFVAPPIDEIGGEDKIEWGGTFSLEQRPTLAHANFRGYNVFLMNPRDYQSDTGSYKLLFKYPDEDSKDYYTTDNKIIVPHGLFFKAENSGEEISRTTESSDSAAVTREWGIHLGGEVGVPEIASFGLNFSYSTERENRVRGELRTVSSRTVQTRYALVMDKSKIELDDEFRSRVLQLRDEVIARERVDSKLFRDFLLAFGTHYPYAVTYGGMAYLEIDYMKSELDQMQTSKVSLEAEAKGTFEVVSVGGKIGGDSKLSIQTQKAVSDERIRFGTYGGDASRGEGWSLGRGEEVPLFLDLRPIYELLNPVFFEDEIVWTTVRTGVEDAFKTYSAEVRTHVAGAQVNP